MEPCWPLLDDFVRLAKHNFAIVTQDDSILHGVDDLLYTCLRVPPFCSSKEAYAGKVTDARPTQVMSLTKRLN